MKESIYILNIIYTLILAGAMAMYCITLGRYFTYIAKNNMTDGFSKYYSVFRKNTKVVEIFTIFLLGQSFLSLFSIILNKDKSIIFQIPSVLSIILILVGHSISGFIKSEEKLNSGKDLSNKIIDNYIRYNLPLHYIYTIHYSLSGYLLIKLI